MVKPRLMQVSVAAAVLLAGLAFTGSVVSQAAQESSLSTPRLANGRPDLSGVWGRVDSSDEGFTQITNENGSIVRLFPSRRCAPNQRGCRENTNQNNDGEFTGRTDPNRPLYKPEYWDKVQELDYNTNFEDPMFKCLPDGVPRIGPPLKIVQTEREAIFLYAGRNRIHDFRIIPTDGRPHDPDAFPTFYGDAVGRWEGDTFVVDVVSFNDIAWLGRTGGYFHSYDLHVIERFKREGDTLHYEVTVDDPGVLLQPWVLNPRQLKLNRDSKITISEGLPCRDYDSEITVSRIRH